MNPDQVATPRLKEVAAVFCELQRTAATIEEVIIDLLLLECRERGDHARSLEIDARDFARLELDMGSRLEFCVEVPSARRGIIIQAPKHECWVFAEKAP